MNIHNAQLYEIAELTQNNAHGEARLYIANKFPYLKHFAKLFTLVNKIHDLEGSINYHVAQYRSELTRDMLEIIERHEGRQLKERLNECL